MLAEDYLATERVRAIRRIEPSPLTDEPAVPRGTVGEIQDIDLATGWLIVEFENGAMPLVAPDEVRPFYPAWKS